MDKINALKQAKGNFDAQMYLSFQARIELNWWLGNISTSFDYIEQPKIDAVICSDASLFGWGAVMENISTGGQWSYTEATNHINYLELLAAFFALKSFYHAISGKHVKILIDKRPFVNTGIGILASALELALELASILHMYSKACKTDPGGYVTALYAIYLHPTANCICSK